MKTDPLQPKTDYRQAGVDIDAGNETVRRIKSLTRAKKEALVRSAPARA